MGVLTGMVARWYMTERAMRREGYAVQETNDTIDMNVAENGYITRHAKYGLARWQAVRGTGDLAVFESLLRLYSNNVDTESVS